MFSYRIFFMLPRHALSTALLLAALALAGCSSTPEKSPYEDASVERPLEMPPALVVEGDNPIAAPYAGYQAAHGTAVVPPLADGLRLGRDGGLRWLEVTAPVEKVWAAARAFLTANGLGVDIADSRLGILESKWFGRRTDVPSGWFERLFRDAEAPRKDRFRLRLERGEDGGTRVFAAHRVMVERDGQWAWGSPDPLLEVELLQRLAMYLGASQAAAAAAVPVTPAPPRAVLGEADGQPVLQIHEGFARSWRHVQLALDRLGFLIQDRDRSAGRYYIKLGADFFAQEESWLSRLFGGGEAARETVFILELRAVADETTMRILTESGAPADAAVARRLLGEFEKLLGQAG